MKWFEDVFNRNIRLTDERLEHIELDHPEMSGQIDKIGETLVAPDAVVRSRTDSEAVLFAGIIREPLLVKNTYVLSLR